jgi:hypothetical protein
VVLRCAGEVESALRLLTDACNSMARLVGEDHLYFIFGSIELSNVHGAAGDFLAARQLGVTTLDALTRRLGPSHPFTLGESVNLFLDGYRCGELQTLVDHRKAVSAMASALGHAHPTVRQLAKQERFSPDVDIMPW